MTPFLGFGATGYAWVDWITGIVAAILAFSMTREKPAQGWIGGIVALWLFVAGFIGGLHGGAGVWWNNLLTGAVLAITGFTAVSQPGRAGEHQTQAA